MRATVFVSYRRDDASHVTDRIVGDLVKRYGKSRIIRDIDSFPKGKNFQGSISEAVGGCQVTLVVIGKTWLHAVDKVGRRRLDNVGDFVRIEIEAALNRGIPVIPLLVDGARMPEPAELPAVLRNLSNMNGLEIRSNPLFDVDIKTLYKSVDALIRKSSPVRWIAAAIVAIAILAYPTYRIIRDNDLLRLLAQPGIKDPDPDQQGIKGSDLAQPGPPPPAPPDSPKPPTLVYRAYWEPFYSDRYNAMVSYEWVYTHMGGTTWRLESILKTKDHSTLERSVAETLIEQSRGELGVILISSTNARLPTRLTKESVFYWTTYPYSSPAPPGVDTTQLGWWRVAGGDFEN